MNKKTRTKFHNMLHVLREEAKKEGLAVKCKLRERENGEYQVVIDFVQKGADHSSASISSYSKS